MTETFDAGWLDLREPFDARARNPALAARFIAALPPQPVIMDLGAGGGSLFRGLAPRIGGDQAWLLVDADAALLEHALAVTAAWGAARGFAVRAGGGLLLRTPGGIWRIGTRVADLADLGALDTGAADGVVCSALLDLVSPGWIAELAGTVTGPVLACLNVDGHDTVWPRHSADRTVTTGFRRDQSRDKGFGPSVGRHAEAAFIAAFAGEGFAVSSAAAPWHIQAGAAQMLSALVDGHASAAARWMPSARGTIAAWRKSRLRQIATGRLAMRIGHRDLLAVPLDALGG